MAFVEKQPKCVVSLVDLLPGEGEDAYSFTYKSSHAILELSLNDALLFRLRFTDVVAAYVAMYPGTDITDLDNERVGELGDVIEFENSQAAKQWLAFTPWLDRPIRHFQVVLLGVQRRVDVFATDVKLI
jgi:hypothetical protein